VTTFEPTSNGTDADQLPVPLAVPDCPMFVDQVTDVTPTLSLAVPLNSIVADDVETAVPPGAAIVKVGGVVSVPPPPLGGVAAAFCLVTVTICVTWLDPAVAVNVMVFTPIANAMLEIVHAALPAAVPVDDPVDQVTEIVTAPPEAEPDRLTKEDVVVGAVALTVSVNAPAGVGVGVGAGVGGELTEPLSAAYIVWMAAMSPGASVETIL
jgi:hypothetical protein